MRLIDADALIDEHFKYCETHQDDNDCLFWWWSYQLIKIAPTIDAVEVVRCNECRFGYPRGDWTITEYRCHKFPSDIFSGNHFCARAEPRPEENE